MVALDRDTIFVTLAGSHAHGTAGPHSDIDLRGVCIVPLPERVSLYRHFEQFEGALDGPLWDAVRPRLEMHETAQSGLGGKVEAVIYDIAKFLKLCASANPNALEIIFADDREWLHSTEAWHQLHRERHRFLTKKVEATYLGYGLAQLKKIRLHRGWLLSPPAAPPTRAEYGLPETSTLSREDRDRIEIAVGERLRRYKIDELELPKATRIQLKEGIECLMADALQCSQLSVDDVQTDIATASLRLPPGVVRALSSERRFRAAQRHWESYRAWQKHRNPARAQLERRHGYDTKHAAHLLRLLETGLEIVRTGELRVRRENAGELVDVINGALTFDQLVARSAELQTEMSEAMQRCTLPEDVDCVFVDSLLLSLLAPGAGQ